MHKGEKRCPQVNFISKKCSPTFQYIKDGTIKLFNYYARDMSKLEKREMTYSGVIAGNGKNNEKKNKKNGN